MSLCLLLVEDNSDDAFILDEMLREEFGQSLELHICTRLGEALEQLDTRHFDAVLLDLHLPDSRGSETFLRLRDNAPRVPVLLLTGLQDEETALWAVQQGAQDYFVKGQIDATLLNRAIHYGIERQRIRMALEESETLYRSLFELAHDGIAILEDGLFERANLRMGRILGSPASALVGQELLSFLPVDNRKGARGKNFRGICPKGSPPGAFETELLRSDGQPVPVEVSTTPIHRETGLAELAIVRDISERRRIELQRQRLEAHLQQARKVESLGMMAGGIAHDFNNLLMGILGHVELLTMDLDVDSPLQKNLDEIEGAAQRAAELARHMLAYSGKGIYRLEEIDLGRFLTENRDDIVGQLPESIDLQYEIAPDPMPVLGDIPNFRQMLRHLVENAVEAIGDKPGQIILRTRIDHYDLETLAGNFLGDQLGSGEYVVLEVQDDGCGMDNLTSQKAFDPFFSTKFTGRGLGLAATLGIVRAVEGGISIESEPSRGSLLRIILPRLRR